MAACERLWSARGKGPGADAQAAGVAAAVVGSTRASCANAVSRGRTEQER